MIKKFAKQADIFLSEYIGGGFSVFCDHYNKSINKIIDNKSCNTMDIDEWQVSRNFRVTSSVLEVDEGKKEAGSFLAKKFNEKKYDIYLVDYGCGLLGGTLSILQNIERSCNLMLYDPDPTIIDYIKNSSSKYRVCTNDFKRISDHETYTDLLLWSVDYTLSDKELKAILDDCNMKGAELHILTPFTGGFIQKLRFVYLRLMSKSKIREMGRARSIKSFKKIANKFSVTTHINDRYYYLHLTPIK